MEKALIDYFLFIIVPIIALIFWPTTKLLFGALPAYSKIRTNKAARAALGQTKGYRIMSWFTTAIVIWLCLFARTGSL